MYITPNSSSSSKKHHTRTHIKSQILELDRGAGIPFEGNYSEWLDAKATRLAGEERAQGALQKSIAAELEFMRSQAKGQQKKGAARARRYDELVEAAGEYVKAGAVDSITIPVGPRLGSKVLEVDGLRKAFGDRLLLDGFSFSLPAGAIVGVIGGNGAGKSTLFRMIMVCFVCVCVWGVSCFVSSVRVREGMTAAARRNAQKKKNATAATATITTTQKGRGQARRRQARARRDGGADVGRPVARRARRRRDRVRGRDRRRRGDRPRRPPRQRARLLRLVQLQGGCVEMLCVCVCCCSTCFLSVGLAD